MFEESGIHCVELLKRGEKMSRTIWRVCASCEWIFDGRKFDACPRCGFAHYSAYRVYGRAAYRYKNTQKPWVDRKMDKRALELFKQVREYMILDK